jgi:hypothetical protein
MLFAGVYLYIGSLLLPTTFSTKHVASRYDYYHGRLYQVVSGKAGLYELIRFMVCSGALLVATIALLSIIAASLWRNYVERR